jgi:endonuclease/exonuclease/phosphatase family metal-dependent hydrolase
VSYSGRVRRKTLALLLSVLAVGLATQTSVCQRDRVRVATYNIRQFGKANTDIDRLTTIIGQTDADVLAVQEIQSEKKLREVARRLSQGRRRFDVALSRCGGKSEMHVGFLYDTEKLAVVSTKEYPELDPNGGGSCNGERPGFAATFVEKAKNTRFTLLVVHLLFGGERERVDLRKEQWRKAHQIAADIGKTTPVAILGDTNSTGWDDDDHGERTFIRDEAKKNGLVVATNDLRCSEYWTPGAKDDGEAEGASLVPSTLDHVVASPSIVKRGSLEVHSFCKELACKATAKKPTDFEKVTDHCPVTFDLPAP